MIRNSAWLLVLLPMLAMAQPPVLATYTITSGELVSTISDQYESGTFAGDGFTGTGNLGSVSLIELNEPIGPGQATPIYATAGYGSDDGEGSLYVSGLDLPVLSGLQAVTEFASFTGPEVTIPAAGNYSGPFAFNMQIGYGYYVDSAYDAYVAGYVDFVSSGSVSVTTQLASQVYPGTGLPSGTLIITGLSYTFAPASVPESGTLGLLLGSLPMMGLALRLRYATGASRSKAKGYAGCRR